MIQYSLLTTDPVVLSDIDTIQNLLVQGIKVIAFGKEELLNQLAPKFKKFLASRLLQVFPIRTGVPRITVEDGNVTDKLREQVTRLSEANTNFNSEQYWVEHADAYNNILVEAGAGTGKTTVMIDRVFFLLHTVPGLTLEDIGMITFTNDATQNMKHKIQNALMQRYLATNSPKYLRFLEDSTKMQIQTIDSFAHDVINELGAGMGYARTLKIGSLTYEKRQLIYDLLNERFKDASGKVSTVLGEPLVELDKLIEAFWTRLEDFSITDDEITHLDWGEPKDRKSKALHETLRQVFSELLQRYDELKLAKDTISVGEIVREMRRMLINGSDVKITGKKLRYLFVDEFQDSDNAQIQAIAWLQKHYGMYLFAVGDIKQSIYRFRGAVETAFKQMTRLLEQNSGIKPNHLELIRNYRTSADVLKSIDPIFRRLENQGLLDYGTSLQPQKHHAGQCKIEKLTGSGQTCKEKTQSTLIELLSDCAAYTERNGLQEEPTQHVTVLTRTNSQLEQIRKWCEEKHIPCYIQKTGTFYESSAVRDLFCLVKAFLFPNDAVHVFDYLNSSYCNARCDIDKLREYLPGSSEQLKYLHGLAISQGWIVYQRDFKIKPVLTVIREIISESFPVERYLSRRKEILSLVEEWEPARITKQLTIDAAQYQADLDKLMLILQKSFSGQMVTLYQIYSFLQTQFLTNRQEDEPDVLTVADYHCVYGMTVHKAKGLEFDTVFLPLTNKTFRRDVETEILLGDAKDPSKIGWCKAQYKTWSEVASIKCNDNYESCCEKEFADVDKEEARILYVALTRAIRRLTCFAIGNKSHSWAQMLEVES